MEANFAIVQPWILAHEGGYVNHPRDPGGATNQGVTQDTYDAWRRAQKPKPLATQDVRKMTPHERDTIYREEYWNVIRGNDLPAGVDYAVYDFAVNSGPARAARYLQRVVGAKQDGIVGSRTLAATAEHEPEMIVRRLCNDRMEFLRDLSHWPTFGRGWTRRVVGQFEGAQDDDTGVVDRSIKLVRSEAVESPTTPAPGKAIGDAEKPQEAPEPVPAPTPAPKPVLPVPAPDPKPETPKRDVLVDQPTNRTARKVKYSSGGGGLGALAGVVLGAWTFDMMPADFQAIEMSEELWTAGWAGLIGGIAALQLGRRVRETLDNMMPTE